MKDICFFEKKHLVPEQPFYVGMLYEQQTLNLRQE